MSDAQSNARNVRCQSPETRMICKTCVYSRRTLQLSGSDGQSWAAMCPSVFLLRSGNLHQVEGLPGARTWTAGDGSSLYLKKPKKMLAHHLANKSRDICCVCRRVLKQINRACSSDGQHVSRSCYFKFTTRNLAANDTAAIQPHKSTPRLVTAEKMKRSH